MVKLFRGILILVIIMISLYLYNYNQIKAFRIKEININSHKISNTIKITQISDFHSNRLIDMDRLKEDIQEFNPDMIVLTGDIMDYKDENLDTVFKLLKTLKILDKDIYFIKGNHETNHILYNDFKNMMENLGVIVLEDNFITALVNEEKINIIGLNFIPAGRTYQGVTTYEDVVKEMDLNYFNLLLVHSPNNIEDLVSGEEDLILAGHTHGGQFRLPIIGPIIAPGQGLFPKLDKGLFKINDSILYIDSGLGNSVAPIRGFNPVQISNITVESGNR